MNVVKVNIRAIAESRGITTAYQLMKATGVQPNLAAKWYKNDLKSIAIESLNTLCKALNCRPDDLLVYIPEDGSAPV